MVKLQHVHLPQFSQHFQYTMMPRSGLHIDPIRQLQIPLSLRFRPLPCRLPLKLPWRWAQGWVLPGGAHPPASHLS